MPAHRITFIINPVAGGRDKGKFEQKLKAIFGDGNHEIETSYTLYPSHAYEFARHEAARGTAIVVAVGGDGTINEVARALIGTDTVLGVIPFGSGNGFARHFGLPLSVNKALKTLKTGHPRSIDVGYINGKPFFCTSGMGFDAETGYFFSHYDKRGFLSYALSFLRVFRDYHPVNYTIRVNGTVRKFEAFFINIANISQFGYHFYVAPGASTEDGFLDLVVVRKFPKWKGLFLALRSFTGTIHKSRYVYCEQADEIEILEPSDRKIIHIDGEPGICRWSHTLPARCRRTEGYPSLTKRKKPFCTAAKGSIGEVGNAGFEPATSTLSR